MASKNLMNMVKSIGADYARKEFPVQADGTLLLPQGAMVYLDGVLKELDTDAHADTFKGVASDQSYIQPYATKKYNNPLVVLSAGVFKFKTTASDSLVHDTDVYIGADSQTITTQANGMTRKLGKIYNPNGISLTGGTDMVGVTIDVK